VYSSHSGQRCKHLFGINNKTWDFVQSVVDADIQVETKDKEKVIQKVMVTIPVKVSQCSGAK
jgi:hypothetical protein